MCQKWEGDCGFWVPNEIILKIYAESLKKSWEPFGRYLHSQSSQTWVEMGWIGCAI